MRRASALGCGVICVLLLTGCSVNPQVSDSPQQDDEALIEEAAVSDAPSINAGMVTEASPVALTATDGSGLQLLGYRARAVRQGPLALTELALTFRNPVARQIEGRFTINMPVGATISRFAMKIAGKWQEGEVVERQKARVTFESFLHVRRDPALLEKDAGTRFRARIFPIPASGTKQIKISYTQELTAAETPYRLSLRGLPKVGLIDIKVWDGQRATVFYRRQHQPRKDFVVAGSAAIAGLRSGDLVVARVRPILPTRRQPISSLLVLLDSSASRAFGLTADVKKLQAILEQLKRTTGGSVDLTLAVFDQQVTSIFEGPLSSLSKAPLLRQITERGALGASDLGRALSWAARKDKQRVLLITDAVPTAGATERSALRERIGEMGLHIERLDVLLTGGLRDRELAATLACGNGLARDGAVLDVNMPADLVVERLTRTTTSGIRVAASKARWVWPERLDGLQDGDEVLVYAQLKPGALNEGEPLSLTLGGAVNEAKNIELLAVEQPLLQRAVVRARIARLMHLRGRTTDVNQQLAYRRRIAELSRRFRVLSDFTALLVLETEQDYERFEIDRRALADILIVTPDGRPNLLRRRAPPPRPKTKKPAPEQRAAWLKKRSPGEAGKMGDSAKGRTRGAYALKGLSDNMAQHAGVLGLLKQSDTSLDRVGFGSVADPLGTLIGNQIGSFHGTHGLGVDPRLGLGTLGTIGKGGGGASGYGYGGSRGLRGRRSRAPRVLAGRPEVRGSLSAEIIRRIIRRHINEAKYCYARELQRDPDVLQGRVVIRFVIAATGQVVTSRVDTSTLDNRRVESCIAKAVRRWLFPKPNGGGIVIVRYPFVLRPTEGGGPAAVAPRRQRRKRRPGPPSSLAAYSGRMKRVMVHLRAGRSELAFAAASYWRNERPTDLLALVALGQSARATGRVLLAARAFGSIIDLYPSRAEMRRFAGGYLESLGEDAAAMLAVDTYRKAVSERPDHATGHRMLAWALVRAGDHAGAFEALARGLRQRYPAGRFVGVRRVLKEELGLVGAAWAAAKPWSRGEIEMRLADYDCELATRRSLRFVLSWETDANDVDLHVYDGHNNHAYSAEAQFSGASLPTGGAIDANVTNGFGPERFAVEGRRRAYPYRLRAYYKRRGPAGYGLGTLQIIEHDGRGQLAFRHRPFVVMNDDSFAELGLLKRSLL